MNFLLKIVEGPMKGAEIALVTGLRLKVGSGDECDIVLADSALAPVAFELDVGETSVSLIAGDKSSVANLAGGETKTLAPFEIFRSGDSGFAVGPAEGAWQPLVDPSEKKPVDEASSPRRTEEKNEATASEGAKVADGAPTSDAAGTPRPQDGTPRPQKKRRGPAGCLIFLFLLLVVLGALIWYFWPRLVEKYRQLSETTTTSVVAVPSVPTLAEIAADHGLALTPGDTADPRPTLAGNVRRRTERLAIRALALASDPTVKFDLTDDETLQKASDELLFVVSEGRLKATAATNRVVTLVGYAPTAAALEKAVRALNADVKGIARLETSGVQLGGVPPASSDAPKAVFAEPTTDTKAPRSRGTATDPAKDYPIAGILTVPYPCVVLRDGMRLTEGATLGNATIEKIEASKLVLKAGKTTFEWEP